MMERSPKVGIGVMVIKDGKMLLGKRKNAHGEGTWSYPGGHLEFGESWEACSKREVLEETGIQIKNLRFGMVTNDVFEKEHKHYITIFIVADFDAGDLKLMEPHKCEQWDWFEWGQFPEPLFLPIINQLKTDFNPLTIH